MIEIGLCADENFAMPCGVCITSIFESNKDSEIKVHILTDGFSDESISRFNKTADKYNQIIEIHTIDSSLLDGVPTKCSFPIMAYARLLFTTVLDPNIEKLLYLDCDIIVLGSIDELWNTDITDYSCACVPDTSANDIRVYNRLDKYDFTYVNSGVILMNLNEWRNRNIGIACIEYARTHPSLYFDQDAINVILGDQMCYLDFKYNLMTGFINLSSSTRNIQKKYWTRIYNAVENPVIRHYSTSKPWHKDSSLPDRFYFTNILKISQWNDYRIRNKNRLLLFPSKSIFFQHIKKILEHWFKIKITRI